MTGRLKEARRPIAVGLGKNWAKESANGMPVLSPESKMTARAVGEMFITGEVDGIILSTGPTKSPAGVPTSESREMARFMLEHFLAFPDPTQQGWFIRGDINPGDLERILGNHRRRQLLISELNSIVEDPLRSVSERGIVTLEEKSFDTLGNAHEVKRIIGDNEVILVTVGFHMLRSLRDFRREGVRVVRVESSQGVLRRRGPGIISETKRFGYAETPEDAEISAYNASFAHISGIIFEATANVVNTLPFGRRLIRAGSRRIR